MTHPAIRDIRARLAAATPGPWMNGPEILARGLQDQGMNFAVLCSGSRDDPEDILARANAAVIAHAPTDISTLLSHVERLEAALRPFADFQAVYENGPQYLPTAIIIQCYRSGNENSVGTITVQHVRSARAALNGEDAG